MDEAWFSPPKVNKMQAGPRKEVVLMLPRSEERDAVLLLLASLVEKEGQEEGS